MYHPTLESDDITALIVWDALSDTEASGIVSHYNVMIREMENNDIVFVSIYTRIDFNGTFCRAKNSATGPP